jgi:Zn-dependent protease with chaperone function
LSIGVAAARFLTSLIGRRFDDRHWTTVDFLRFSLWGTLASTLPLLLFAAGIDALDNWQIIGLLWIVSAGLLARFSRGNLRMAAGFKPRLVKSGEMYKRSFALAEKMGVPLIGVFVVPAGKGRSINAHSAPGFIGMIDTCVHCLRGAQLDFVIAHELDHTQRQDGPKHLRIAAAVFCGMGALTFVATRLPWMWQAPIKFVVILFPILVFHAVSRRSELAADRAAVEFTGDPETAIRSLVALNHWSGGASARKNRGELLASHPSFSTRINAIARFGHVPDDRVKKICEQFSEEACASPTASD